MAMSPGTPAAEPATWFSRRAGAVRSAGRAANARNVAAGSTAVLWYTFGAIPLFLGVVATVAPSPAAVSSWFFITFLTSGVATLILTLRYRQPLAVGWTLPGLVLLGAASAHYSLPELMGASLAAGIALLAAGILGAGERLMRWLPLPLVLGMFAGSTLHYITDVFAHLEAQPAAVGAALAGYFGARAVDKAWLPPVGGAAILGIGVAAAMGQTNPGALHWSAPQVVFAWPAFEPGSLLTVALPIVILVIGTGNVQGFGVLASQGFRPPVNQVTTVVGISSVVNALFGGHPASIQTGGTAILAGEDAGPPEHRYLASAIAGAGCIVLAFGAATAGALVGVLPAGLVASLAGLAILRILMEALKKTMTTDLALGSFFALVVAASPLTIFGIGPAFWGLAGGYLVSLVAEPPVLRRCLRWL